MIGRSVALISTAALLAAVGTVMPITAAQATEMSKYTVGDLLAPCLEGDNDARWGAAAETECEQYVSGFVDGYLLMGGGKRDGVCLPPGGNRPDEVRWAFMRWSHRDFERRKMHAAEGLLGTIKAHFPCKK